MIIIGIGFAKCGTSELYCYFKNNYEVLTDKVELFNDFFKLNLKELDKEKIYFTKTPAYIRNNDNVLVKIKEKVIEEYGDNYLIIINERNLLDRNISHYLMLNRIRNYSFDEFKKINYFTNYIPNVKNAIQVFGKNKIKVINYKTKLDEKIFNKKYEYYFDQERKYENLYPLFYQENEIKKLEKNYHKFINYLKNNKIDYSF